MHDSDVKTAFTKDYYVKTATLIHKLQITPEAQKGMKVLCEGKQVTTRRRSIQNRDEYLATHDQERRAPWKDYKMGRSTYFRRRKAGTLPPLPKQIEVNVPVQQIEKNKKSSETSMLYIMTRARVALLLSWCQVALSLLSDCMKKVSAFRREVFVPSICSFIPVVPRWLRVKSLMYFKRRRKSKRKRKRKRG